MYACCRRNNRLVGKKKKEKKNRGKNQPSPIRPQAGRQGAKRQLGACICYGNQGQGWRLSCRAVRGWRQRLMGESCWGPAPITPMTPGQGVPLQRQRVGWSSATLIRVRDEEKIVQDEFERGRVRCSICWSQARAVARVIGGEHVIVRVNSPILGTGDAECALQAVVLVRRKAALRRALHSYRM